MHVRCVQGDRLSVSDSLGAISKTVKLPDLFIFIDEVEDNGPEWKEAGPALFYWCIVVPKWKVSIVQKGVRELVKDPGRFHAKDKYKLKSPDLNLMRDLTQLIIANKIECLCFPFFKGWLKSPRLLALQEVQFTNHKLRLEDYRVVSFYLLVHYLNWYVPRYLAFQAQMWLVGDRKILGFDDKWKIFPGGRVLNMIDRILINTRKDVPLLVLPDHVGHISWKSKKQFADGAEDSVAKNARMSPGFNEAVIQCNSVSAAGLFRGLNFWTWVEAQA